MNIDKNMHVPISIQIRTLKSMLIHQSELGKTLVELEGGWELWNRRPFCRRFYLCPVSDSFLPSFSKATLTYFTRNDQNRPKDAVILLSHPWSSKFLVALLKENFDRRITNFLWRGYDESKTVFTLKRKTKKEKQTEVLPSLALIVVTVSNRPLKMS